VQGGQIGTPLPVSTREPSKSKPPGKVTSAKTTWKKTISNQPKNATKGGGGGRSKKKRTENRVKTSLGDETQRNKESQKKKNTHPRREE